MDWSAVPFPYEQIMITNLKKQTTMKKTIFGIIAIVSLMAAVCVTNDSAHELEIRFLGTVVFGLCAFLGGWMDGCERGKGAKQPGSSESEE